MARYADGGAAGPTAAAVAGTKKKGRVNRAAPGEVKPVVGNPAAGIGAVGEAAAPVGEAGEAAGGAVEPTARGGSAGYGVSG